MCINDESLPVNLHNTVKLTEILTKSMFQNRKLKKSLKIWLNDKMELKLKLKLRLRLIQVLLNYW